MKVYKILSVCVSLGALLSALQLIFLHTFIQEIAPDANLLLMYIASWAVITIKFFLITVFVNFLSRYI